MTATAEPPHRRSPNRLAREKSPYLLQHQWNPVDWYPWGPEAFEKARAEDRPIFLSIGYSTCHWCHVMERESFESPDIARLLNDHFVSIKVDREERPDVDKIYMTFVQATTGHGGWPLNAFLTPELKPFYGGTYFPPADAHGRPGFPSILEQIARLWQEQRVDLRRSSDELHERLRQHLAPRTDRSTVPGPDLLHEAARRFREEYDPRHGGFGGAPKFPRPSQPAFLLAHGVRYGDDEAVRMVLHTCERMAAGGIRDHVGGGFARYSVDAEWLVPHFEKMLYDNAQLVPLYLDSHLVSGQPQFAEVARDTLEYVLRDLTHPDGGFYSAEDADSEGKEGKFYCWTRAELAALLEPEEFRVAVRYYGLTERGNFVDHSDPAPLPHQNVLSIVDSRLDPAELPLLESARRKLFAARAQRVRPHRDDKILVSWNGLMLGAFARASVVLGEPRFRQAAERNLAFLERAMWEPVTRTLHHRWREGERDQAQLLDDYAFLLAGVLDLYEATLDTARLEFAISLAEAMLDRFHDPGHGGFWQSGHDTPDLILRVKEDYDGAEPSGNSVAALALLRLGAITGQARFRAAAEGTLRLFAPRLERLPEAVPHLLQALAFWLEEPHRVVIAGDPGTDRNALLHAAHRVYRPGKVIHSTNGPVDEFARTLRPTGDRPTAYVCSGTACQAPAHDPAGVDRALRRRC